MEIDLILSNSK